MSNTPTQDIILAAMVKGVRYAPVELVRITGKATTSSALIAMVKAGRVRRDRSGAVVKYYR